MLRVGNDIVDLMQLHAKKKIRDTRFLKRVFLPDEIGQIQADREPDHLLWAFWSGKEAAYKAIRKEDVAIRAIPHLYRVSIAADRDRTDRHERLIRGTVATPFGVVRLKTSITSHYVHSLATPLWASPDAEVVSEVSRMALAKAMTPGYESYFVRNAAKRRLADYFRCRREDVEIRRHPGPRGLGPPYVYLRNELAKTDLSLSHDGSFVAYAFAISS